MLYVIHNMNSKHIIWWKGISFGKCYQNIASGGECWTKTWKIRWSVINIRCIFSCHVQGVQWKTCEGQNVVTSLIPWPSKLNKLKKKCFEIQYSSWLSKLKIIFTSLSCQTWGRKMKVGSSICNKKNQDWTCSST